MLLSKPAAGPADDRVCVTGHRGHKERVRTMERKPTSFYFQFSASFFSCLLLFCSRLTRLPVLAPLHSSCRFLGWELSSAAAWAWNGSEEREGAGDAERDLMRMYGCGCVCVCVWVGPLAGRLTHAHLHWVDSGGLCACMMENQSPTLAQTLADMITLTFN